MIDPKFIDVNLETEGDRTGHPKGFIHDYDSESTCRGYGDAEPLIPESQWRETYEKIKAASAFTSNLITRIYDQDGEGSCFPPGTLITMATGEVRPIEDVKCLESVVTAEGNHGEVRQAMARPYIGQLIGIHLHGNNLVRCTPEHPILTRRGYVAANELIGSDYVAITKVRSQFETKVIQTAAYLPHRHRCRNELRTHRFGAPEGRTLTQIQVQPVPDVIELDEKFGRILGLFLAEGHCDKQKIVWTFNINEADTLAADLRNLLDEKFEVQTKVRIAGSRCTIKIEMYGTLWARLFEGLCSTGSGSKRLCAELASGSTAFLRAVFDGWMSGDGHRSQRMNTGVTISRQLAVQMLQIGTRLGLMPALRRSEPKVSHGVRTRRPRYDLTFGDSPDDNYRRIQDERHCWRKVRILTVEDYNGPVYNLHVHGDESYVADGLGVHNCVGNMEAQFHQVLQARQFGKDRVKQLSAASAYKQIGRSPNSGASISDALDCGLETGILPLDTPENRAQFGDHVLKHIGFRQSWPSGWESTAKHFRFQEFFLIRNRQELFSALLRGFPVGVGRAGHSILYTDLVWDESRWLVRYVNSWGEWGSGAGDFTYGFGYDTSRLFDQSARWAWTARSIVIPPWETIPEPKAA